MPKWVNTFLAYQLKYPQTYKMTKIALKPPKWLKIRKLKLGTLSTNQSKQHHKSAQTTIFHRSQPALSLLYPFRLWSKKGLELYRWPKYDVSANEAFISEILTIGLWQVLIIKQWKLCNYVANVFDFPLAKNTTKKHILL